jgi:hypothetical protein
MRRLLEEAAHVRLVLLKFGANCLGSFPQAFATIAAEDCCRI